MLARMVFAGPTFTSPYPRYLLIYINIYVGGIQVVDDDDYDDIFLGDDADRDRRGDRDLERLRSEQPQSSDCGRDSELCFSRNSGLHGSCRSVSSRFHEPQDAEQP